MFIKVLRMDENREIILADFNNDNDSKSNRIDQALAVQSTL